MEYLVYGKTSIHSTTCPLSGGGYYCECDGGATECNVWCPGACDCYLACVLKANCCGAGGRENPDMRHLLAL